MIIKGEIKDHLSLQSKHLERFSSTLFHEDKYSIGIELKHVYVRHVASFLKIGRGRHPKKQAPQKRKTVDLLIFNSIFTWSQKSVWGGGGLYVYSILQWLGGGGGDYDINLTFNTLSYS